MCLQSDSKETDHFESRPNFELILLSDHSVKYDEMLNKHRGLIMNSIYNVKCQKCVKLPLKAKWHDKALKCVIITQMKSNVDCSSNESEREARRTLADFSCPIY